MPIYESKKVSENFRALKETCGLLQVINYKDVQFALFQQTLTVKMTDELWPLFTVFIQLGSKVYSSLMLSEVEIWQLGVYSYVYIHE